MNTVRRHLALEAVPKYNTSYERKVRRATKLSVHEAYLRERQTAAQRNWIPATVLYREILQRGYRGGQSQLRAFMRSLRPALPVEPKVRFETAMGEQLQMDRLAADAQRAVGAVDDARPDRWGEKVIRLVEKPKRLSLMEYLYYAGDDRFGALGVSTSSSTYSPRARSPLPRLGDAQQLSEVAAKIEASEPITVLEARIIAGGGSPLGGAKPKALIDIDGEQWVLKFFNNEPVDTPLIEHATMTLAKRAGITVAETQVIRLADVNAIAIRRFDREQDRRIHSISAGTAIRRLLRPVLNQRWGTPSWRGFSAALASRRTQSTRGTHASFFAAWSSTSWSTIPMTTRRITLCWW